VLQEQIQVLNAGLEDKFKAGQRANQDLEAKLDKVQARHDQDMDLVNMKFAGMEADVDAKISQERLDRQQSIDGVESKLDAERLKRERAIDEVQARHDQDMEMMDKQLGSLEVQRVLDAADVRSLSSRVAGLEKRFHHLDDALRDVLVLYPCCMY